MGLVGTSRMKLGLCGLGQNSFKIGGIMYKQSSFGISLNFIGISWLIHSFLEQVVKL